MKTRSVRTSTRVLSAVLARGRTAPQAEAATPEDMEAHIDIADWLIRTRVPMFNPGLSRHSEAFLKVAQFVDPKYHAELEGLIDDFELEFVGFEPKPSLPSEDFS